MSAAEPNPKALLGDCLAAPREERAAVLARIAADDDLFVALGDEAERLAFADVARALEAAELVVELADLRGGPRSRARARRALAQALAYAGRHDESLAACQAAVEVAGSAAPIEAGRARVASLHPLNELGRYDDAIAAGEEGHRILTAAGEPALAARADLNLGGIHQNRGDSRRALLHFDRAAAALVAEPLLTGYLQNNRGEALLLLNDFSGAEACFRAALKAAEEGGAAVVAAIAQGNIADLETRRGRLSEALHHFEHARRRLEDDVAHSHVARLLGEEAEALETLGLPDDARAAYESALSALDRLGMAAECARTRAGLGRVLLRMGQSREADAILRQAGAGYRDLGHAAAAARVDLQRSAAALAQGEGARAAALLASAAQVLEGDPLDRIPVLAQRAAVARAAGDLASAERDLNAAVDLALSFDIVPLAAQLLHSRALCRRAAGDADGSLRDLVAAAQHRERMRGSLRAERFATAVTVAGSDLYDDLLTTHLSRPQPALGDLFEAVELAKSRTLLDRVGSALDVAPATGADARVAARCEELREDLSALFSRLADHHHAGRTLNLSEWQERTRDRQRELESLEQRRASAGQRDITRLRPIDLDGFAATLGVDAAAVEFFICGGMVHALVLRGGQARLVRSMATLEEVERHLETLPFQMQRAARPGALRGRRAPRLLDDVRAELRWFHDLLVRPWIEQVAGTQRLAIIPHGPLHAFPMHAAWDGARYLIERCAVHYAPSASVLASLAAPGRATGRGDALAIGVADERATEVEREAEEIAATLGGACLLGRAATVAEVVRQMPGRGVIHFACHGYFDADRPEASGLRLRDRWLGGADFSGLRLTAELVTLSGCNTGRHALRAGEELIGLVRGFLSAGAANVLVTLWAAHDEKTRHLMREFYTMLPGYQGAGGGCAAALAEAARSFMQKEPHPCFWAPFILMGRS